MLYIGILLFLKTPLLYINFWGIFNLTGAKIQLMLQGNITSAMHASN